MRFLPLLPRIEVQLSAWSVLLSESPSEAGQTRCTIPEYVL